MVPQGGPKVAITGPGMVGLSGRRMLPTYESTVTSYFVPIDHERRRARAFQNALQTGALMLAMVGLLAACGWIVAGAKGVLWLAVIGAFGVLIARWVSRGVLLRLSGAMPLRAADAPEIYKVVSTLAARAQLDSLPALYYLPSPTMNAVTVGKPGNAAIAVTDGLLRSMPLREFAGVMAHEISHIRHNDIGVMMLAAMIGRMTRALSFVGLIAAFFALPLLGGGADTVSWAVIALLIAAPMIVDLLQLALSRTREFAADTEAARLTGDPAGLAAALLRIEGAQTKWWQRVLRPGQRQVDSSLLRTHPRTEDRVAELVALGKQEAMVPIQIPPAVARWPAFMDRPTRRPFLWIGRVR